MTPTAGRTAWCAACHHLVRLTPRAGYLHVSDDDWSQFSCPCANQLRPCVPEPRRHRAPRTYLGLTSGGEYTAEPWFDPWNPGDGFRRH